MQPNAVGERRRPPRQRGDIQVSNKQSESEEGGKRPKVPIQASENKHEVNNRASEKMHVVEQTNLLLHGRHSPTVRKPVLRSASAGSERPARPALPQVHFADSVGLIQRTLSDCEGSVALSKRDRKGKILEKRTLSTCRDCSSQSDVSGTGAMFAPHLDCHGDTLVRLGHWRSRLDDAEADTWNTPLVTTLTEMPAATDSSSTCDVCEMGFKLTEELPASMVEFGTPIGSGRQMLFESFCRSRLKPRRKLGRLGDPR